MAGWTCQRKAATWNRGGARTPDAHRQNSWGRRLPLARSDPANCGLVFGQLLDFLFYLALVPVPIMLIMAVTVVEVVHMASVLDRLVPAIGTMDVGVVVVVDLVSHVRCSFLSKPSVRALRRA